MIQHETLLTFKENQFFLMESLALKYASEKIYNFYTDLRISS